MGGGDAGLGHPAVPFRITTSSIFRRPKIASRLDVQTAQKWFSLDRVSNKLYGLWNKWRDSWSITPKLYRRLCYFALVGLSLIIITGGAVRLTQSGLGCPTWPNCKGNQLVAQYSFHPMIEFTNRVITIFLTVAVMVASAAAFFRKPFRRDLAWLSMGMVGGLVAQVILGGITVLEKLAPPFVMAHFILSLVVVLDALVLYYRSSNEGGMARPVVTREVIWLSRIMWGALAFVLFVGTAVTGSGPHSGSPIAKRLPFALRDVAQLHADGVLFLIGLTLASIFLLHQSRAPEPVMKRARTLLWIMAAQGVIGYTQYFSNLPALLVGFHIAGATAVWIAMIWHNLNLYERTPELEELGEIASTQKAFGSLSVARTQE